MGGRWSLERDEYGDCDGFWDGVGFEEGDRFREGNCLNCVVSRSDSNLLTQGNT